MSVRLATIFSPRWAGVAAGVVVASMTNYVWSQALPAVPPAPTPVPAAVQGAANTAEGAANTAQDTATNAVNTAQDTATNAANTAQDTATNAANTAQNTATNAANTAQNAAQNAANTAQDTATNAANTAQDATRNAANAANNATRDAANTARDATRNATDTVQDAQQNVRDTARGAATDARNTARDVNRNLQQTTRNAAQGANATVGNAARSVQGAAGNLSNLRGADLGIWFNRSAQNGLIIADIASNAALGRIGFVEGDRIVSVAGQPIANETDFVRYMLNPSVRGPMNVVVLRNGQQQTLAVDPIVLQQQLTAVNADPLEDFGIVLDDRFDDRLVVWRVIPRSPAFYSGIRAGDVISTFAGQRVATPSALVQLVSQAQPGLIPIQVTRNGRARTIEVDMAQQHITARQNLDANARTNETYIRSDVNAGVNANAPGVTVQDQVDANATLPADTAPVLTPSDRPVVTPTYRAPTYRRGIFRRR